MKYIAANSLAVVGVGYLYMVISACKKSESQRKADNSMA
jgi:hypothetical protein